MVTIRDLHSLSDYADCVALQDETWGAGFSERVPTAILRVSQMIGGVAAGAFDENDRLVGFVFGLTGIRNRELVHWSDMLAVRPELRSQGIGERLKQYQRDKVLRLGVRSMLWTFDPLQAGNAHFNINHLGALPIEYIPDMYGNTGSTMHGTMPTDRFIVRWLLDSPVARAPGSVPDVVPLANPVDSDDLPVAVPVATDTARVRVQIPADMTTVRTAGGPEAAVRWRLNIRELMTDLLSRGYRVISFSRAGRTDLPYYVLTAPHLP